MKIFMAIIIGSLLSFNAFGAVTVDSREVKKDYKLLLGDEFILEESWVNVASNTSRYCVLSVSEAIKITPVVSADEKIKVSFHSSPNMWNDVSTSGTIINKNQNINSSASSLAYVYPTKFTDEGTLLYFTYCNAPVEEELESWIIPANSTYWYEIDNVSAGTPEVTLQLVIEENLERG